MRKFWVKNALSGLLVSLSWASLAQSSTLETELLALKEAVQVSRIEQDITTLAGFGTRHTLSDTQSNERGIGAARRWIEAEFRRISFQFSLARRRRRASPRRAPPADGRVWSSSTGRGGEINETTAGRPV